MEPYALTESDLEAIERALDVGGNLWVSDHITNLKKEIKKYYRKSLGDRCCYCARSTHGEHSYVLHVEHVLPQSHPEFSKYIFEPRNLSVSCVKCNFGKGAKVDFLRSLEEAIARPFESETYLFIHPLLDSYFDHINYESVVKNTIKIVAYTVINGSEKGAFTYRYFDLRELEINSLQAVQGGSQTVQLSELIPENIRSSINLLTNTSKI